MKRYKYLFSAAVLGFLVSCETKQDDTVVKAIEANESFDQGLDLERDEAQYLEWLVKSPSKTVFSFENERDFYHFDHQGGSLKQSSKIYHFGKKSLKWDWLAGSEMQLKKIRSLNKKESSNVGQSSAVSPSFITSVFNPRPINDSISFEFSSSDGQKVSFEMNLNFSGWRTIWVPFYEMKGAKLKKRQAFEVKKCTIKAPALVSNGELYFDDMVLSQYADDRHQYPDSSVAFIKSDKKLHEDHWMPNLKLFKLYEKFAGKGPLSEAQQNQLHRLEAKLDNELDRASNRGAQSLQDELIDFGLNFHEGLISGRPLKLVVQVKPVKYEKASGVNKDFVDFDQFCQWLYSAAAAWKSCSNPSEKVKLEAICMAGMNYLKLQGYQAGSGQGTLHHLGYQFRNYVKACYLLRTLLSERGQLESTAKALAWFMNTGAILQDESEFFGNIDYYNTISFYRLLAIMMTESEDKKFALVEAFNFHLGKSLAFTDERGVFKVDGTAWHHHAHYPAYAVGAFSSVGQLFKVFNGTGFKVESSGHENFRKALLASRVYCQKFDWGLGLAGRHPMHGGISHLGSVFLALALSGTPDGSSELDKQVAEAYLRLWGEPQNSDIKALFDKHECRAEPLDGNWTYPYADLLIHRRDKWMASIKGYSKNVWSSEIYTKDNRYGRYQSNGTVQIMSGGNKADGYVEDGWDWNRAPGATVIEYPHAQLEPQKDTSLLFRSQQSFAGGLSDGKHGVFGMNLNSLGLEGRLKARKSVFAFGDKLVCLGSDISSREDQYMTSTVLFQHQLKDPETQETSINEKQFKQLDLDQTSLLRRGESLRDSYGNTFVFLKDTELNIRRQHQRSPNNKYSVRRDDLHASKSKGTKFAEGNFASAVIEHGKAIRGASYAYLLYPHFKGELSTQLREPISIRQQDRKAHVVSDKEQGLLGVVAFEKCSFEKLILAEVHQAGLLMLEKQSAGLRLTIANPDVNDATNEQNKRLAGRSLPLQNSFILKGKWQLNGARSGVALQEIDEDRTKISVMLQSGLSKTFELTKVN